MWHVLLGMLTIQPYCGGRPESKQDCKLGHQQETSLTATSVQEANRIVYLHMLPADDDYDFT